MTISANSQTPNDQIGPTDEIRHTGRDILNDHQCQQTSIC